MPKLLVLMSALLFSTHYISDISLPKAHAQSKNLYINVGKATAKKSLMAFPPISFLGTPLQARRFLKHGKEVFDTIKKDLSVSSYFDFIDQNAFLENTAKTSMRPKDIDRNGFKFESWNSIGAEFLIRAGYKIVKNQFTLESYVYYVPKRKLIFSKSFSGSIYNLRELGHTFSNYLVKRITGQRGIFLTKVISSRSTRKGEKEIFEMDWDGKNSKAITNHKSISQSPSWSPDGRFVAYTAFTYYKKRRGRNADLYLYDRKSKKKWILSNRPGINSSANFMPDSRHVVYRISKGRGGSDIYKISVDGKNPTPITRGPRGTMNVEPAVRLDGSKILFSSDRSGKPMVYSMNINGSGVKRLTFAGDYNSSPAWSPDGKKIAFAGLDKKKGNFDVFVMDATGLNLTRITSAKKRNGRFADNEYPSFSPDGRHIMFASNRTGKYQLYVANVDGTNEHRITFDNHEYFKPQWSPFLN